MNDGFAKAALSCHLERVAPWVQCHLSTDPLSTLRGQVDNVLIYPVFTSIGVRALAASNAARNSFSMDTS